MKKITLLFSIILISSFSSFAQNDNWIIGNSGRVKFTSNTSTAISISSENGQNLPPTPTGYTSVSDGCGRLLFVTNGNTVWTYFNGSYIECSDTFAAMPRTDIRQNVVIIPKPYNENNFFIMTVTNAGVYFTDFYVETDGSSGHVENSFIMNSSSGFPNFQCTALTANVQRYFSSFAIYKHRIMLFNQTDNRLYTYYVDQNGIDLNTERTSLLTSYISANSYVNNFATLDIGTSDSFMFSTNLGDLVFFKLLSMPNITPAFVHSSNLGTEITGLNFSNPNNGDIVLYIATANGLYKSAPDNSPTVLSNPILLFNGNIGDLKMGNDDKIYGAIHGGSTMLQIGDPNNYLQPNVTSFNSGFVNSTARLGQLITRNPKLTYLNLITPIFNPIGPFCSGTDQTLPTTSANGITGTWSPAYNKNSPSTYTFTPNAYQCSEILRKSVAFYSLPTITTQPTTPVATCSGTGTQTISVVASGVGLSYSWLKDGVAVVNNGVITGQGTASLTLTNPTNANVGSYKVNIGTTTCPTSIKSSNTVNVTLNTPPTITTQPTAPVATCSGTGTKTLSVVATGTGLAYSWRKNGVALINGGVISGQGTSSLVLTNPTTANAGSYTVVISGTCSPAITSNAVTVAVNSAPTITTQPVAPVATCSGTGTKTLSVVASGTGLTYSWRKNGVALVNGGVISGQSTSSLTLTNPTISNTGSYTVVVTGTCSPAITSNAVNVSVNSSPTITTQPTAPVATCSGTGTKILSVLATGTGLTYSWRKDGVALVNGGVISGQATSSLTLTNPTLSNVGSYTVVVTGTCSPAVTSSAVAVSVNSSPIITTQPIAPVAICSGTGTRTLSVVATGTGLTYSWRRNGVALVNDGVISGQGTASLSLTNATSANAGSYSVVVTGTCSPAVTSNAVAVTVNPIVTPTFNQIAPKCFNSSFSALPTISLNGVTGTWSPDINNMETTTYTFTPSVGQCANIVTMTIEVYYIVPTFDDVAIISTSSISYNLPDTSTNGITGYWEDNINEDGGTFYTFLPYEGQCAKSSDIDFMYLQPQKLKAYNDNFSHPKPNLNPPAGFIDKTVSSVLENDLDWDTFGTVTLLIVSTNILDLDPTLTPVLNQSGTITFPSRFWSLYDSISISYKITQNSCPSNYAIATATITSYNPNNATARKAQTNTEETTKTLNDIIAIYPNPSTSIFNIDLSSVNESYDSIKVYNILGATVYENHLNVKAINQVDLSHVSSGYYTARLFSNETSKTIKLIKK